MSEVGKDGEMFWSPVRGTNAQYLVDGKILDGGEIRSLAGSKTPRQDTSLKVSIVVRGRISSGK